MNAEQQADREAEQEYFIRSFAEGLMKKMEFRFFKSGSMWTSMFYKDGADMETWHHAGEVSCECLQDSVMKCHEMAWTRALLLAAAEIQSRGVR